MTWLDRFLVSCPNTNGEPISLETILFAAAVVATVLIAQRMRAKTD
jgi:hypothetical protein